MKNDGKPALTPKLRFPEFQDAEGWDEKEVGEVFQVTRGDVLSMKLVRDTKTAEMPYPVYSSQTKNNGLSGFYSDFLFEDAITWTTDGANAGDVNYRPGKFYCTNVCGVLLNSEGFANPCVAALINSVSRKYVSYVGNPKLMNGVMSKIGIPFPSVTEQQKIAECLTSVDELIAAQARKVDALKTHKKGLMQQLFPREGETQPRLRFPEFQSAGEWVVKSIGQLGEVVTGSTPSTARPEYYGGDRLFVSPSDISDGRFIEKTKTTLTALGFEKTRPIKANSILFVCIGSTIGKIAQNRHESATNQQINSVVPNSNNTDGFVYYALSGLADKIANLAGIQAVPIVNKSLFSSVELLVPMLPEQQRIADCLTSLDNLIAAQTQKLDALKTHKKGLMQQLFPSTEEVEA
ncbi:MAG: restriction endonuclease subunit S [Planctomycetota bacterium]